MFHIHAAADAKLRQLCPTLYDPVDGSPAGSPVPGILQARTLEWVAIFVFYLLVHDSKHRRLEFESFENPKANAWNIIWLKSTLSQFQRALCTIPEKEFYLFILIGG